MRLLGFVAENHRTRALALLCAFGSALACNRPPPLMHVDHPTIEYQHGWNLITSDLHVVGTLVNDDPSHTLRATKAHVTLQRNPGDMRIENYDLTVVSAPLAPGASGLFDVLVENGILEYTSCR
ncbi:hypothetical protein BH09MYX1_BH09MYX1_32380 [soil metagenome]